MDVLKAIKERRSIRAFLDREVEESVVRKILDTARWAPSGVNSQPWQVAAVSKDIMVQIGDRIIDALDSGQNPNPDYQYYPKTFPQPYKTRRMECGQALYGALGIQREDKKARKDQWYKNYYGFDAPVVLFVFIEDCLEKGSWIDTGMFIQNIMLAARAFDLETCPQAALAEFPDIVRSVLNKPPSLHLVCGIAIGFPDPHHPVNNYRTDRERIEHFTTWHGF